jgi:hypothetical protein
VVINTKLVIWDETPMIHHYEIEAPDLSLKDKCNNIKSFGMKTIVFG